MPYDYRDRLKWKPVLELLPVVGWSINPMSGSQTITFTAHVLVHRTWSVSESRMISPSLLTFIGVEVSPTHRDWTSFRNRAAQATVSQMRMKQSRHDDRRLKAPFCFTGVECRVVCRVVNVRWPLLSPFSFSLSRLNQKDETNDDVSDWIVRDRRTNVHPLFRDVMNLHPQFHSSF